MCVWVTDVLPNSVGEGSSKSYSWLIITAWYMGIVWAQRKTLGSHFPSFSLSPMCCSLSLFHFPNQVLKRNIKHFCSTMPPLSSWDCVCVHGVYEPEPSDVLIFPCVSPCLRPPTVWLLRNSPCLATSAHGKLKCSTTSIIWPKPGQIIKVAVLSILLWCFCTTFPREHLSVTQRDAFFFVYFVNEDWIFNRLRSFFLSVESLQFLFLMLAAHFYILLNKPLLKCVK